MFLYHFVEDRQMYVDIDACKAGFSAYAYYLRDDQVRMSRNKDPACLD